MDPSNFNMNIGIYFIQISVNEGIIVFLIKVDFNFASKHKKLSEDRGTKNVRKIFNYRIVFQSNSKFWQNTLELS